MEIGIKEKFPTWCKVENMKKYNSLCLSDDLDSLFSCIILQRVFPQLQINVFYDFNNLYTSQENINKCIAIDADLMKGKCWGNHITLNNKSSANLNRIMNINNNNYYQKFCGSTLLQIISYYNIDINNLTELQKMILLTIDSTYLGFWFNDGFYCKKYLKLLELECLIDILERHSKEEFKELDNKYLLNKGKIWLDNGQLKTDIHLEELEEIFNINFNLVKENFKIHKKFELKKGNLNYNKNIFSCAMTFKNSYMYSIY